MGGREGELMGKGYGTVDLEQDGESSRGAGEKKTSEGEEVKGGR